MRACRRRPTQIRRRRGGRRAQRVRGGARGLRHRSDRSAQRVFPAEASANALLYHPCVTCGRARRRDWIIQDAAAWPRGGATSPLRGPGRPLDGRPPSGGRAHEDDRGAAIDEPIVLDGRLDEPAWQRATPGSGFVQREPDTGQPASEDTEVRVVYTPTVLYIGLDARDREPERVIAKEMQRDEPLWRDDAVDVVLDTFDDDRNAYLFETNPNGARTDAMITDEGRSFNLQWDGVWDVAARRTADRLVRRDRDPLLHAALRPEGEVLGLQRPALRPAPRRAGVLGADPARRGRQAGLALRQPHRDPRRRAGPEPQRQAVRPWPPTQRARRRRHRPREERLRVRPRRRSGASPAASSLDLTVNTDFAETEVDALQTNLTRFPLFFPEKRYFFLENAGIFDFGPREATVERHAAHEGLLLAAHRPRPERRGGPDRVGRAH